MAPQGWEGKAGHPRPRDSVTPWGPRKGFPSTGHRSGALCAMAEGCAAQTHPQLFPSSVCAAGPGGRVPPETGRGLRYGSPGVHGS